MRIVSQDGLSDYNYNKLDVRIVQSEYTGRFEVVGEDGEDLCIVLGEYTIEDMAKDALMMLWAEYLKGEPRLFQFPKEEETPFK